MPAETKNAHNPAYFTKDGVPRHELFDAEAQEEARKWVDSKIESSQVRRFFGQAQTDKRKIEIKGKSAVDEDALVAMAFLKAASAYADGRRDDDQIKPLSDFMAHHAKMVRTKQDFSAFLRHFEAVVAWHRVFKKKDKQERNAKRNSGYSRRNDERRGGGR